MNWQFDDLPMFGFDVVVADFPWPFELYSEKGQEKSAAAHYATMSVDEIFSLRVGELARGDCLGLFWGCGCNLPLVLEAIRRWGFVFKSEMIWRKVTRNGKVRMGPGYRVRTMHEPIIVATIGNPQHKAFPSIFDGLAREHSRKPDEFYELVQKKTPGARRLDLFARQSREGWSTWGNEATKFDPEIAADAA